jgi:very-short-patch-repair endonuclease
MKSTDMRELGFRFASQHGVVARAELRLLGVDSRTEQRRVDAGQWARMGRRVIRLAGSPRTPQQWLMAACLEAGATALASHQSAAWLWGFAGAPDRHSVTVARNVTADVAWAGVHRSRDAPEVGSLRSGIPCTNPLRTLVDLAATDDPDVVDAALDRALSTGLLTVHAVEAEIARLSRPGRRGVGAMREALRRRGFVGAPHPSVLESKLLRLLRQHRVQPIAVEIHAGPDGRYRVDVAVSADVLVEVDGYSHHHTPEQKAEDERRRNRIRLSGAFLLVYTWRDVLYDGPRVVEEIRLALAQAWGQRSEGRTRQLTGASPRPPVL